MTEPTAKPNDPQDMRGHVLAWPKLLRQGFELSLELPETLRGKQQIVCAGMGGSAIGAGLVGDYAAGDFTVPFAVVRDYDLPAYVGPDTLVLCLSYSGGTEETLSCYEQAKERGAAVAVVTTGGELADRASADGIPTVIFEYESQPRAALPLTLGLLLRLFGDLGYLPEQTDAVAKAATAIEGLDPAAAQGLAERMAGKIPIVYGSPLTAEAARRAKGQISENANQTAAWEVLPEQNHNALVGLELPKDLAEHAIFVFLRTDGEHSKTSLRFTIVGELLTERGLEWVELHGAGPHRLAQLATILYQVDLASLELAYRNGVDPTPVDVIAGLKARLAEAS